MRTTKLERFVWMNPEMSFENMAAQLNRTPAAMEKAFDRLERKRRIHLGEFAKWLNGKSDIYHPQHGRLVVCFPADCFSVTTSGMGLYWSAGVNTKAIDPDKLTDGHGNRIHDWMANY